MFVVAWGRAPVSFVEISSSNECENDFIHIGKEVASEMLQIDISKLGPRNCHGSR